MAGADFTIHPSLMARGTVDNKGMSVSPRFALLEIDGDAYGNGVLANYHELVSDKDTVGTGIIVLSLRGVVTEAIAQSTTQMVATVRTKGTTPATIGTITAVDNMPKGDIIDGSITAFWGEHTSDADISAYCVPAGYGLEVALTTAGLETDSSDTTGRILVLVEYLIIPKTITEAL